MLPLLAALHASLCAASDVQGGNTTAVAALIDRVVGVGGSASFVLQLDPQLAGCQSPVNECVALANLPGGKIGIAATSLPSLGFGVGTYLRSSCNASLTWVKTGGLNARCKPGALPPVRKDAAHIYERSVKWTYYQNVVDSSYSFVWWDAARWRTEVDWMSLIGINIALVYTGQEKVLLALYKQFGVDLTNTSGNLDYFNGPAYLSWSRGQSQAGVGGVDAFKAIKTGGALPSWWYEQQADLGKAQATMMRELGMTTILRGFEVNVPGQLKQLYPTANISAQGSTSWALDALDPLFVKLSDAYMKLLITEFGTDHYYQADGFFNSARGPWAYEDDHTSTESTWPQHQPQEQEEAELAARPACVYSAAINFTYIKNCPGPGSGNDCKAFKTLTDAESACSAEPTCGGVTLQRGSYSTRVGPGTTPSPAREPSTSWLLSNPECHPPPPPPPPPRPRPRTTRPTRQRAHTLPLRSPD